METKYCKKCEKDKLISEFSNDKTTKDGLNSQCKECANIYYLSNKERKNYTMSIWNKNNQDKLKKYRQDYFQENKLSIYEYSNKYNNRRYREDNTFKLKALIRSCIRGSFNDLFNGFYRKSKKT